MTEDVKWNRSLSWKIFCWNVYPRSFIWI